MESPRTESQNGLSLVELLVVVAVIGILVALLVPVAQKIAESARTAQCSQKLRDLGAEILGTAYENNGTLAWYEKSKGVSGMWWHKVHSRNDFSDFSKKMTCPSAKNPYQYNYSPNQKVLQGTYRYNKYMGYQSSADVWTYPLVSFPGVARPSRVALVADFVGTIADRSDDSAGFETFPPVCKAHRKESLGLVFCLDGHIEYLTPDNPNKIVLNPRHLEL